MKMAIFNHLHAFLDKLQSYQREWVFDVHNVKIDEYHKVLRISGFMCRKGDTQRDWHFTLIISYELVDDILFHVMECRLHYAKVPETVRTFVKQKIIQEAQWAIDNRYE